MNAKTIALLIGTVAILSGQSLHAASGMASTTCHIKFVSFAFTGTPGTAITYHGQSHTLPAGGYLELVAFKNDFTYKTAGLTLSLSDDTPRDEFGSALIDVNHAIAEARTQTPTVQLADASTTIPSPTTF